MLSYLLSRRFPPIRNSTVYLDIETPGLNRCFRYITKAVFFDGEFIQTYVQRQKLDGL
jgi:hypothetical protein